MSDKAAAGSHASHWGAFSGRWSGDSLTVTPHPDDPAPAPLLGNIPASVNHRARVRQPMIRKGWLDHGPGASPRRGRDEFVAVSWDTALDHAARALREARERHGAEAIYGGSYGWASAGRFHQAQGQVHRFLNMLGGYVRSVNNYSAGAAMVILPHILAPSESLSRHCVNWDDLTQHTDIVLAFGGMATKNTSVSYGGISRHTIPDLLQTMRRRGTRFVLISPQRTDMEADLAPDWFAVAPGTDTALMLGLAHTLLTEQLHDAPFLATHCQGFDTFRDYLLGAADGQAKDAEWAARLTGIAAPRIVALARDMAKRRTFINVSQSLQRAEHGEQPVWMAVTLAAMLGQIGVPGAGFCYSLCSSGNSGHAGAAVPLPALPQGQNAVSAFIPVARIADMLLNPGASYDYNGKNLVYPDIRLVYWAGGNPFHHHQDINRLREAFGRPETIIVHESAWTATARHADIVLPATTTLERNDLAAAGNETMMIAMKRLVPPLEEARDDYDIFAALAKRLGCEAAFTEGRSSDDWIRHLYEGTRATLAARAVAAPDFDTFWSQGELRLPAAQRKDFLAAFRADPVAHPLPTPSGRIEIVSEAIGGFGYADCPPHPTWLPPTDTADPAFPLRLLANNPATRLHSQLDFGAYSQGSKVSGREPMLMHPDDAGRRGIQAGDIVRLFNERGACLAAAALSDAIRPGTVQLATGAWYDPDDAGSDRPLCVHGNPNVLTRDIGTSRLAQGCAGALACVEAERFEGPLPPIRAYDPPMGAAQPHNAGVETPTRPSA